LVVDRRANCNANHDPDAAAYSQIAHPKAYAHPNGDADPDASSEVVGAD